MLNIVTQEVFRNTSGMSYSRLSKLADSPQAYRSSLVEDVKSSAIDLGSLVDIMLTESDELHNKVYVMMTAKPSSDMMLAFVHAKLEGKNDNEAHQLSGYSTRTNVISKFETEGKPYYDAVIAAGDKMIVDFNQITTANQIVATLKSNPYTKPYFTEQNDHIELIFQVPIIWKIETEEVTLKSVLDIIQIDHEHHIIQPVDLKTGAEPFYKGFFRYKRYLQGSMYTDATIYALKDKTYYKVLPMKFIFADTTLYKPPIIYNMIERDIEVGRDGLVDQTGRVYKGYLQLIKELLWHQKNDLWDYSYDVYQNNGEVDIDAFEVKL